MNRLVIFILILFVSFASCKKESFITSSDATIYISADTIKYDTVFVTAGSITQSFKIFNTNNQKLLLSQVKLMGGSQSSFKININGIAANQLSNIEIAANDSIYVFVSVTINPNSNNLPFIISDSISVNYNGNEKFVQLQAYGQNAHFLNNQIIEGNVTWTNDLPYVILGSLQIDTTATLNINAGCKIYTHADAPILVDGILKINGEKNNEVIFNGDRLDEDYKDLPASWPGIYFRSTSNNNEMTFAIIKNANQAVVVSAPSINANPKLSIHQCIIDNAFDAGLLIKNSFVNVDNSIISNCGNNINIINGGEYHFTNCTAAAYSNLFMLHRNPVLQVNNFSYENGNLITNDISATFANCIFWGDGGILDDEVMVNKEGSNLFNVIMSNCLYKSANGINNAVLNANIINEDPIFDSIDVVKNYYDFRMNNAIASPAIDNGGNTSFPLDLDNQPRQSGISMDIGCYEKQ
jgi:hypothetical protein